MPDRRKLLAGVAATSTVALSGCSAIIGPTPEVVDAEGDQSLSGVIHGEGTLYVIVENDGFSGDVEVTVLIKNENDVVLDRYTKTVKMGSDERRRVEFAIDAHPNGDSFTFKLDSSGLL